MRVGNQEAEMRVALAAPTRPILRYHGGKWKLAPWILSHFPDHRIYVEPYGGAASVLMRKPRSYGEVYNDLDGEVVNLFQVLRDPILSNNLVRLLYLTPFAKDEFYSAYESSDDPVEQARRTVFRSFAGFGSGAASGHQTGFRSNSNRSGTTPAHDWANFPDCLQKTVARLRGIVIENKNALELIDQHDTSKTLFYLDPPYPLETRMPGAHYAGVYRHEMDDNDHRCLADVLHNIKGMAVVSGYSCALYDEELYPDWHREERNAYADCALERTEVLWISPRTIKALNKPKQIKMEMIRGVVS